MPIFIFDCECGKSERKLVKPNETVICQSCGQEMSKNIIQSVSKQFCDKVPGGYDDNKMKERIVSKEGMIQEAAYLAGETGSAY
jgi:hypothetical protein